MELKTRELGKVAIIEVHGKLLGGPDNSEKFHGFFRSLLDDGKRKFVINLEKTPWGDSHGVALLMGAHANATKAGGNLVLANVSDRIKGVLRVMKLDLILKSFDDEAAAVKYMADAQ